MYILVFYRFVSFWTDNYIVLLLGIWILTRENVHIVDGLIDDN